MRKSDLTNNGRFQLDGAVEPDTSARPMMAIQRNAPDDYFLPPESDDQPIAATPLAPVIEPIDPTPQAASLGDIAIVGFSSDTGTNGKGLALVVLTTFTAPETITITDNGWTAAGAFRAGEGTYTFTIPAGLPAGTVITISGLGTSSPAPTIRASDGTPLTGTASGTGINPAAAGDQFLVYQGSSSAPTFLFAVDFADGNTTYAGDATNSNTSAVPTGLTFGTNALAFGLDNGAYTGPLSGSRAQILSNIANPANWTSDDAAPVPYPASFNVAGGPITLSINDISGEEGDTGFTTFRFTITLSGPAPTGGVTFDVATAPGTATTDVDYFRSLAVGLFIPAGQTSLTYEVLVGTDLVAEADETFFLNVTNVVGTNVTVADGQGLATILNDDTPGSFAIGDVTLAEGNGGTTAFTFTITRTGGSDGAADVSYTVTAPGGAGFAGADDFAGGTVFSGIVSFANGQTSQTITLDVVGDTIFEPNEAFTVDLTGTTAGTITDAQGVGTITNDDAAPAGTLSINDVTLAEGNAGATTFTFTVTRSGGTGGAVTADYVISAPGGAGNANAADFVAGAIFSGQVAFADGEASRTISIDVASDTDFEGDETFTVTLANATGGASIGDGSGLGTIQNDDVQPAAGSISIADASITEGNAGTQILTLTVTRTNGTAAFDVNYATANGGTPGNAAATAGSDYVASSGTLSFAAGQTSATIQITINGDTTPELDEEFTVTLSGATNGATIADATALATILSDDPVPASTRIFAADFTGFAAAGFAPNPTATQLDSDIWRVAGLTDNPNPAYGFTATTGDFARGTIGSNNPTDGGVYSPSSNPALVVQPTGSDFEANGFIEARIANSSGSTATGFDIAFDWSYRNSGDRASSMQLAYSVDGVNFVNVPAGAFTTPAVQGAATNIFALQPVAISLTGLNVASGDFLYLRWIHASSAGSGSRDEVGIDNVTVDATGGATGPLVSVSDVSVNEAAGTMTFTVTRSNAASGAFTVDYATANGTATAGTDYTAANGTLSFGANQVSQTVTVAIADEATPEADETLFLNLSNATGATIADGQGVGTIVNDDGAPIQVSVNDVSIVEGQSGTSILTFTVTRTGGTGAFNVNYSTVDDTATSPSDYNATDGTLVFAAGENSQTVQVTVNGDLTQEQTERFFLNLSGATNDAIIVDAQGIGTIVNDEPTLIHDIQGSAYFSPILLTDGINNYNIASTTLVTVRAVITAVDVDGSRTGFYITEENSDWDANLGTSEGIFVMFSNDAGTNTLASGATTPALGTFQVGDVVTVTARVMEYQSFSNMPVTVLTLASSITRDAVSQPVPTFTLDSNHPIPNGILTAVTPNYLDGSDDAGDTFDYGLYALSYFETIESMLVTVPNMRVADGFVTTSGGNPVFQAYSTDFANPGQINSRGGYTISGDPALSPPDTATVTDDVRYGGRVVHDGDTNPDIIELDFTDFAMTAPAGIGNVTMGDFIGNVTGIIGFDFTDRKLYVTDIQGYDVNVINGNTPARETATFSAAEDPRQLTIATFNVENLDPSDGAAKFQALANAIVTNLRLPDILSIEEMQDNNGANASGGADASVTWGLLVDALNAAATAAGSNARYQWVDQEPTPGAEGGEPGGNIRVGFLYNTARVQLGDLAADASLEDRRKYTDRLGDGTRDAGDLIQFDDSMIGGINTADYTTTRKSLLGEFKFNGQSVFVLANHLPAKGGSGSFWQFNQNLESGQPANSDWAQRNAIGEDIFNLANYIQTNSPNAGFVAGGDFNDFQFTRPLEAATGYVRADGTARNDGARLTNMTLTLAEAERYTYTFDGRSQAIDHILVNQRLATGATYDVVHLNTGYGNGSRVPISDHDPAVVRIDMRRFDETVNGTAGDDLIRVDQGGNDTVNGGAGNDGFYFGAAYTSADTVNGGDGNRDQIGLQGNYAAGVTLGTITGVELLVLLAGNDTRFGDTAGNLYSYNITAPDAAVAAGQRLIVQANTLRVGENFTFNGAAETDGSFLIYGGLGTDTLTGGSSNDGFFFGQGRFGATDVVNGGAGAMDQLGLQGNYTAGGSGAVTFGATQLSGLEFIVLLSAVDTRFGAAGGAAGYDLTTNDGNVAAGQTLTISANTLQDGENLTFNGSAETNGRFEIFSGNGNDVVTGGAGNDLIFGGGRGDTLTGGAGNDVFAYRNLADSNSEQRDGIQDFTLGDLIDLSLLDGNASLAGRQNFTFVGSNAFTNTAGELRVQNVSGPIFLIQADANGDGVSDLEIILVNTDGHTLSSADFIGVNPQSVGAGPIGVTDKPIVADSIEKFAPVMIDPVSLPDEYALSNVDDYDGLTMLGGRYDLLV